LVGDPRSSEVALRWLERENISNSDILLGIQRTVDPISPLVDGPVQKLSQVALTAQNYALRKRLGGTISRPTNQTVLYLIYRKNFEQHYGALLFTPEEKWIPLGPAEKIHQRIADTIETAERTLAEASLTATLSLRLTQLWKSIWQDLIPHLDPEKPLTIAPVGMLHNIPWATLRNRKGRHLCEIHPDVRILSLMGKFPKSPEGTNPVFCGFSEKPKTPPVPDQFPYDSILTNLVGQLAPLPGVTSELEALTNAPALNPTKQELLQLLKRKPRILHLAGHGFVIDDGGFRAGLALTEDILFAQEIANLDLSGTQTVILSACRGGIGRSEVGGNWTSLRRSFIAAGTQQVLAAQWRVRDDELPSFMARFHKRLQSQPAHLALWHLQREWLSEPENGPLEMRAASAGAWVMEGRE